jgi:hypothetical protein
MRIVKKITKECPICGVNFKVLPCRSSRKYCGIECRGKQLIGKFFEKHPAWKGGEYRSKREGCEYKYLGDRKYIAKYRQVAEKALGRRLKQCEVVHHINGDNTDNRNENLLICGAGYHKWLHEEMSRLYMKEHFGNQNTIA